MSKISTRHEQVMGATAVFPDPERAPDSRQLCEAVPMDVAVYAVMQNAAVVWDPVSRTHIWKVMIQGKPRQGSHDEMCKQVKEALRGTTEAQEFHRALIQAGATTRIIEAVEKGKNR